METEGNKSFYAWLLLLPIFVGIMSYVNYIVGYEQMGLEYIGAPAVATGMAMLVSWIVYGSDRWA